jgi:peptidoglycan/xylan/chitin deacetylase (PgdA/CDA1 family)
MDRLKLRILSLVGAWFIVTFFTPVAANEMKEGAIIRAAANSPKIALVFTGHDYGDQAEAFLDVMKARQVKGSFFLTGDFVTNTNFSSIIRRIVKEGHYLGPHSDKHLLYCSWENAAKTLITREQFMSDLQANVAKIEQLGIARRKIKYFLPAYEHYNRDIAAWTKEAGMVLVNYTPGTRSMADYTTEKDQNFVSSWKILESIRVCERTNMAGLNGFILLLHVGAGPERADKFSRHFPELLDLLLQRKYQLVRIDELLTPK